MSYRPDYERILNEAVETVMPKTPEDWGLLSLAVIGIWFAITVIIIVLEAARASCTRSEDEPSSSELRTPLEG